MLFLFVCVEFRNYSEVNTKINFIFRNRLIIIYFSFYENYKLNEVLWLIFPDFVT